MHRHPDLVPLSREHHAPLRLGKHLVAGRGQDELARMRPALLAHFRDEERELLPLLEGRGEHLLAQRLKAEHAALEALIDAVLQGERLAETGRALIEHVRFEERELFPRVEVFLEQAVS